MQTLRICALGLSADPLRAFHSMLKVVEGRSVASWQPAEVERADVLIAHPDGAGTALDAWNRSGKPVILLIDDRASRPPAPFVLRQPFRVMQLLAILDQVAQLASAPRAPLGGEHAAWETLESLRRCMAQAGERGWHASGGEPEARIWIGAGCAQALPAVIARLREGAPVPGAFAPTEHTPPAAAERLPLAELAWFAGLNGPPELAPWLARDSAYRLLRWPDFGRLHATPEWIELAALAAAQARTPAALAAVAGHAPAEVHRFLAAASLAGLLAAVSGVDAAPPAAPAARSWTRLIGDLRRHLRRVA